MSTYAQKRQRPSNACDTEGCLKKAEIAGLCHACYQYDYYWTRKKNAAQRRQHAKNLTLRATRMDNIQAAARPRRVK